MNSDLVTYALSSLDLKNVSIALSLLKNESLTVTASCKLATLLLKYFDRKNIGMLLLTDNIEKSKCCYSSTSDRVCFEFKLSNPDANLPTKKSPKQKNVKKPQPRIIIPQIPPKPPVPKETSPRVASKRHAPISSTIVSDNKHSQPKIPRILPPRASNRIRLKSPSTG